MEIENHGVKGGYLGVTARNKEARFAKGIEVNLIKVHNLDPYSLKDQQQGGDTDSLRKQYSDELDVGSADLIEDYEEE